MRRQVFYRTSSCALPSTARLSVFEPCLDAARVIYLRVSAEQQHWDLAASSRTTSDILPAVKRPRELERFGHFPRKDIYELGETCLCNKPAHLDCDGESTVYEILGSVADSLRQLVSGVAGRGFLDRRRQLSIRRQPRTETHEYTNRETNIHKQ